jgi:hypothetical protein
MVSSGFLQEPHGVTTQKTPFFIVTAVKTSNLTLSFLYTKYSYMLVTILRIRNVSDPHMYSEITEKEMLLCLEISS